MSLADTVARLEREALESMADLLGGTAACRVDGPRTRPVKHWEGRAAALAEVRRALSHGEPERGLLPRLTVRWSAQLTATGGDAWHAYSAGGLEVLGELGAAAESRVPSGLTALATTGALDEPGPR